VSPLLLAGAAVALIIAVAMFVFRLLARRNHEPAPAPAGNWLSWMVDTEEHHTLEEEVAQQPVPHAEDPPWRGGRHRRHDPVLRRVQLLRGRQYGPPPSPHDDHQNEEAQGQVEDGEEVNRAEVTAEAFTVTSKDDGRSAAQQHLDEATGKDQA
jgi:hypothetical protein